MASACLARSRVARVLIHIASHTSDQQGTIGQQRSVARQIGQVAHDDQGSIDPHRFRGRGQFQLQFLQPCVVAHPLRLHQLPIDLPHTAFRQNTACCTGSLPEAGREASALQLLEPRRLDRLRACTCPPTNPLWTACCLQQGRPAGSCSGRGPLGRCRPVVNPGWRYATPVRNSPSIPSQPTAGDQVDLSLSVVLPVHNAETTLTHNVYELLDVLPEIATRFEILIVDDGSTDQTEEIAHELARCLPPGTRRATRAAPGGECRDPDRNDTHDGRCRVRPRRSDPHPCLGTPQSVEHAKRPRTGDGPCRDALPISQPPCAGSPCLPGAIRCTTPCRLLPERDDSAGSRRGTDRWRSAAGVPCCSRRRTRLPHRRHMLLRYRPCSTVLAAVAREPASCQLSDRGAETETRVTSTSHRTRGVVPMVQVAIRSGLDPPSGPDQRPDPMSVKTGKIGKFRELFPWFRASKWRVCGCAEEARIRKRGQALWQPLTTRRCPPT